MTTKVLEQAFVKVLATGIGEHSIEFYAIAFSAEPDKQGDVIDLWAGRDARTRAKVTSVVRAFWRGPKNSDLSTTASSYGHYDLSDLERAMEALAHSRQEDEADRLSVSIDRL